MLFATVLLALLASSFPASKIPELSPMERVIFPEQLLAYDLTCSAAILPSAFSLRVELVSEEYLRTFGRSVQEACTIAPVWNQVHDWLDPAIV